MNWKKRAAALVALPLAVVGLTAVAADAHSATPHTSSVCNNDGTWSAKFSATNDYSLTSVMSQTGTGLDGSYAKSGQSGDSKTITVTKPVSQTSIAFPGSNGKMVWSDGFTQTGVAWSSASLPSGCKAPDAKDATASVSITPGTCTAAGSASYAVSHAHLVGTFSTTPGAHSQAFASDSGHLFSDGASSKTLSYTVPGKDHSKCEAVTPVNPTVTESVCKPNYGGPTSPTLTLPTSADGTYTLAPGELVAPGQTVTVRFTLTNPDRNLAVSGDWVKVDATHATLSVTFAVIHCAPPPACTACHLPKVAGSQGVLDCRGTYYGGVYSRVVVLPGRDCTLVSVYINGGINAHGAHSLHIAGGAVRGNVNGNGVFDFNAGSLNQSCSADPMFGGNLSLVRVHNAVLCNLQVCGWVKITHATGRVMVRHSRMNKLVVTHNDRFVKDGSPGHRAPGLIRLNNDRAHTFVIEHNARPVQRRNLHHAPLIGGGKVCTLQV